MMTMQDNLITDILNWWGNCLVQHPALTMYVVFNLILWCITIPLLIESYKRIRRKKK